MAGASRYYAGGGVFYTLGSRVSLGGVPASHYENYQGTTPEMLAELAESVRQKLELPVRLRVALVRNLVRRVS